MTLCNQRSTTAQAAFPNRPLDVGKAWREMIHRYAASTLGIIIVLIMIAKNIPRPGKRKRANP